MKYKLLALVLATLSAFVGSLDGAPVPKELRGGKFYFPTVKGTKWVVKSGAYVETFVLDQVKEEAGKCVVDISPEFGGCGNAHCQYHVSRQGVFHLCGLHDLPKPIMIQKVKLPFREGETWTSVAEEKGVEAWRYKFTSVAEETVTVAAGKYAAIRVDWAKVVKGETVSSGSDWYAPNVGRVKAVWNTERDPRGARWPVRAWNTVGTCDTELRAFFPPGTAKLALHKRAVEAAGGKWYDIPRPTE